MKSKDKVRLVNGSREMTVTKTKGEKVECIWVDENGKVMVKVFNSNELKLVDSGFLGIYYFPGRRLIL